ALSLIRRAPRVCRGTTAHFRVARDGHHRDLHSFPTRRSSDLMSTQPVSGRLSSRGSSIVIATTSLAAASCASASSHPSARKSDRDRKSTRLNSSHQIISYAVFCLKKKSNSQRRAPPPAPTPQ